MAQATRENIKAELQEQILASLEGASSVDGDELLERSGNASESEALNAVLTQLQGFEIVTLEATETKSLALTTDGLDTVQHGSPELRVFRAIGADGASKDDLEKILGADIVKNGMAKCMKSKWVEMTDKKAKFLKQKVEEPKDELCEQLKAIAADGGSSIDANTQKDLKKRKMVKDSVTKHFKIKKGPKYVRHLKALATDLTMDMLKDHKWKEEQFKPYNFKAKGQPPTVGSQHPLMKVRAEFRSILLEMGFEEMPTNNFVESSFWNFDALFQPQQHPARDAHDTFFLTAPTEANYISDEKYMEVVKDTHQTGGSTGSIGYRYDWDVKEAKKNLLRTHTTAVSARMLHALGKAFKDGKGFTPKRYFSIDRVFRNESLDAKHLAEFHQVEGFVADRNLTLGDLIGTIQEFFKRIDIHNVHFKPAFNPYTEPSMEIFTYSKELGEYMEIGNSGLFRPEMLEPMGLPEDVRVIAWGLSLERPTMVKYGLKNIRDLFGHSMKLKVIRENPICRYGIDEEQQKEQKSQ